LTTPSQLSEQDQFDAAFAQATAPAPAQTQNPASEPAPQAQAPAAAPPADAPAAPPVEPQVLTAEQRLEEAERQLAELRHRERSVANRLAPVDRKNRQLEGMVADLQAQLAKAAAGNTPAAQPAASAPAVDEPDMLTEAPELRGSIEKLVSRRTAELERTLADVVSKYESLAGKVTPLEQALEPIAEDRYRASIEQTHAELDKAFSPQWRKDVIDNPEFNSWVDEQPPEIQRLAREGVSVKETLPVVRLYYSAKGITPAPGGAPAPAPAAQQAAPAVQPLRRAVGIPSSSASAPRANVLADDDFEGHFAAAQRALRGA